MVRESRLGLYEHMIYLVPCIYLRGSVRLPHTATAVDDETRTRTVSTNPTCTEVDKRKPAIQYRTSLFDQSV